jgi:zinc protease
MEAMEGKAAALAAAEALQEVSFLDREYEALGRVEPAEVREAAARYLQPDNVSAVTYLPNGEGSDLTVPMLERSFAVTALRKVEVDSVSSITLPPRVRVPGRTQAEVLHTALPGADLLVRRKPGVPLVSVGLYVPRAEFDPAGKAGLAALAVRSSARGAGSLDDGELAFAFERLGGTLGTTVASDWLGFGTTVLAERLGEAAVLLNLVLENPRLSDADISTERGLMVVEAERVADDMFRYPFQLGFAAAFGEAGYGVPVSGLPETLPRLTPPEVRDWHQRALLGVRPVIVAVGDIDPAEATATLAGVFQHRPVQPDGRYPSPVVWVGRNGDSTKVVTREKAQAALAMVFQGPSRRDGDRIPAEVWAAVASGLGGRLFEALRDRRSLAYTVLASSWQRGRAGALVTYIATSPEREEEARAAMLDELERFADTPVSPTELKQAVNYLSGQAEVGRQSGSAVAGEILEAWINGNGLEDLENPAAAFHRVTAEDVLRVARGYLRRSERAEGVVRGTGLSRSTAD